VTVADSAPDDWSFGNGGFAKLYGDRLAQSSLLDTAVATRWVFVYMLAQADAEGRYRCATVSGLARAAAISREDAETAIRELEAPDPDSTTKEHEGRRILRIPGGWRIVSYARYRTYQTARQRAEAEKKRRQREAAEKKRQERELARREAEIRRRERDGGDMSRDVPGTSAPDVRRQTPDDRTTEERIAEPAAPPTPRSRSSRRTSDGNGARKAKAESWSKEACALWVERFQGTAPGGRIGKALKPLVGSHGWPEVRAAWVAYLEQVEAEYASPQRFAATFGRWSGSVPPAVAAKGDTPAAREARTRANLTGWVQEKGAS
jgi:hypothetical protein